MSDLKLNFDNGIKNITMGSGEAGNIQVVSENNIVFRNVFSNERKWMSM